MKAQTATTSPSYAGSSITRPAVVVQRIDAIPARPTMARIGSCRARAASSESSRSAAKTGRGSIRTTSARASQTRSSLGPDCASTAMRPAYRPRFLRRFLDPSHRTLRASWFACRKPFPKKGLAMTVGLSRHGARSGDEVEDLLLRIRGLVFVQAILQQRGATPSELEEHRRETER